MITKRRILSPNIFNRCILVGYLIGVLPIPWLAFTVYWVQKILDHLQVFRSTAQKLILNLSTNESPGTSLLMALEAVAAIKSLRNAQEKALQNLRIFSGAWLAISLVALLIFLGGSFSLLLALTGQIEILSKIQKQREMLINGGRSDFTAKTSHAPKSLKTNDEAQLSRHNLINRLKTLVPTLGDSEDEDDDLLGMQPTTTPPSYHISRADELLKGSARNSYLYDNASHVNHSSRKNHKQLVRYCVRFAWQAVFCTLIATSYIVLNIFVVFNVLDAPRSISLSQLLRTIEQWAAWSWGGGPGAVLGLLACVVAFSKNPVLPREPEKGPPSADPDAIDEDDDPGFQSHQHPLTADKLHMHATKDSSSFPASPKRPDAALTAPSVVSSWKAVRPKMSFGSNSQVSLSAPRTQETTSETSAKMSRTQSPFQIISLANSNFVKFKPVKPYPLGPLTKSGSHYQPSHLFTSDRIEGYTGASACPSASSSPKASEFRTQQSYPMPVQITRCESSDYDPFLRSPAAQRIKVANSAGRGHFNAIHQLRERE